MHIGIITSPVPGHINPLCTIGRALKDRGHRVTVFGLLDTKKKILSEGLEFSSYGNDEFPTDCWEGHWIKMAKMTGIFVLLLTAKLHSLLAKVMCRDIPLQLKNLGVDSLIIDQLQFQGKAIAAHCNLPYASVSCTLVLNKDTNNIAPPPFVPWGMNVKKSWFLGIANRGAWFLAELLSYPIIRHGNKLVKKKLVANMEESYSELLQIVPMPKSFDFPANFNNASIEYVGALVDEHRPVHSFPYERLRSDVPIIYASCGTLQNHRMDIYKNIAKACEGLPVQLIIALGDWRKERVLPEFPGNPIVVGYAPQIELLKKSALCVTHAGPNTVYEAFSLGVPLVAIPIANDQIAVGARLKVCGAAEVIDLKKLNALILREKILQVLNEPKYKNRAKGFQTEIYNLGGVKRAASLIEDRFLNYAK